LCYADITFGFDEADSEAAQSGDVLGAVSSANAATVFVVVPVNDVMAAIFNAPMLTIRLEDFFGISCFRLAAGYTVNDFVRAFTGFLFNGFPFNHESLSDMGEIQVIVKRRGCPYFAGFNTSVIRWSIVDIVRFLPTLEE